MEITTNHLSLTGVIMENPQFDHEVFGEAFFRPSNWLMLFHAFMKVSCMASSASVRSESRTKHVRNTSSL